MKAYVLVNIRTGSVKEAVKHMGRIEQVVEVNITFGPYDAVAIVEAANVAQLGEILYSEIQPIPGVLETLTCLAVDV